MAINREAAQAEMEKSQSERNTGGVNFIGKGTFLLRVLEFTDGEGIVRFARKVVKWGKQVGQKRKDVSVHRSATFGDEVPDAIAKYEEILSQRGEESPYSCRKQYFVNAIDLNDKQKKVERWALPTGVWEDISAVVCNDQWLDVLEPDVGHAFMIVGKNDGLDREYTVTVERNPWPVSDDLMQQVVDPFEAVRDPGLEGQCKLIGATVEELFGDGAQLEYVDSFTGESAPAEPTPPPQASATPPRSAPAAPPSRPAPPQRNAPPAAPAARGGPPPSRPPSTGVPTRQAAPAAAGNKPVGGGGLIRGLARPPR